MASLTKDQLKNELITHGVELPSSSARKDEYVRLYEKYVAPLEQTKGDFSSDDEDISPLVENKVNMEQNFVIDGIDITKLDDDQLFSRLEKLGATVGPIVDSTRKVYQKKLLVLMGGDVVDSPTYNGDVDEEEYSDSEEADEVVEEEPVKTRYSVQVESTTTSPPVTEHTDVRKRLLISATENAAGDPVFDPDRHTPSPRRSLRSVMSTTTSSETITVRKNFNNGRSGIINTSSEVMQEEEEEEDEQARSSKISLVVRLLVKLLFLGLIIALILYIYQNDPSESPFKAVEQLARQALEAAVGEEAEVKEGDSIEPVESPVKPPPPEPVFPA